MIPTFVFLEWSTLTAVACQKKTLLHQHIGWMEIDVLNKWRKTPSEIQVDKTIWQSVCVTENDTHRNIERWNGPVERKQKSEIVIDCRTAEFSHPVITWITREMNSGIPVSSSPGKGWCGSCTLRWPECQRFFSSPTQGVYPSYLQAHVSKVQRGKKKGNHSTTQTKSKDTVSCKSKQALLTHCK